MSVFETLGPAKPTAQQGALRLKRTLAHAFQQIETSLAQARQIVERHGRSPVDTALGADKQQAASLYQALKTFVEKNKPGSKIPDLPS